MNVKMTKEVHKKIISNKCLKKYNFMLIYILKVYCARFNIYNLYLFIRRRCVKQDNVLHPGGKSTLLKLLLCLTGGCKPLSKSKTDLN